MNLKTRLLICDDHPLVREGIKVTLSQQPTIEIVAEATNGREAVSETKRVRPDMVLMDMSMPELNGMEATIQIKEFDKDIKVLIMTMYDDEEVVMRCLAAGASGYILKDAPLSQLVYAIGVVRKGHEYLDPGVTRNVNEYLQKSTPHETSYDRLSPREREVLKLVAEGLSVKEIATRLSVAAKTIDTHKYNLMTKLDIHNAAGLIRYAIQNKVIITLPALKTAEKSPVIR
jgi:two-component system, NarL family, response regulator NreC